MFRFSSSPEGIQAWVSNWSRFCPLFHSPRPSHQSPADNYRYSKNANVYIAGRSKEKADESIKLALATVPSSTGRLEFLFLDLADLSAIKKSAETFLSRESRLDVLWNNAGVMRPPVGSRTKQNYETQLGTNCLGPFLFTQLLLPILVKTATLSPPDSVRICWTSSLMAEASVPKGVINFEDINGEKGVSQSVLYSQSKAGNIFLGWELARRNREDGLISVVSAHFCSLSGTGRLLN